MNMFIMGLVKSDTSSPMTRSKVIPNKPFINLFLKWEDNNKLSIWALHMKAVVLLAFSAMLRPSDVTPRSVCADYIGLHQMLFDRSKIEYRADGSISIEFHGIKNDYSRDSFKVQVQQASNSKICPVVTLKCYLDRTSSLVDSQTGPVFVTLNRPYSAPMASSVSGILNKAIDIIGLSGQGFSAKCFRPSGATATVEAWHNPNSMCKIGRWKDQATFEEYYVHAKAPANITDNILLS